MPSFTATSNISFSSSTYTHNGETTSTGTSQSFSSRTDPSGTTTHSSTQNSGEPAIEETRQFDNQGNEIREGRRSLEGGEGQRQRIVDNEGFTVEDVTEEEAQKERDAQYEERMEEEYAKREGGA